MKLKKNKKFNPPPDFENPPLPFPFTPLPKKLKFPKVTPLNSHEIALRAIEAYELTFISGN